MLPDDLKAGDPLPPLAEQARWDYTSLLPEEFRESFRLEVRECPGWFGPVWLKLISRASEGRVGTIDGDVKRRKLFIGVVDLEPRLRGKGIGRAMYLALIVHAVRVHGCGFVCGDDHSLQAHRVHVGLSTRYGFVGYRPDRWLNGRCGEYSYQVAEPRNLSGDGSRRRLHAAEQGRPP